MQAARIRRIKQGRLRAVRLASGAFNKAERNLAVATVILTKALWSATLRLPNDKELDELRRAIVKLVHGGPACTGNSDLSLRRQTSLRSHLSQSHACSFFVAAVVTSSSSAHRPVRGSLDLGVREQ